MVIIGPTLGKSTLFQILFSVPNMPTGSLCVLLQSCSSYTFEQHSETILAHLTRVLNTFPINTLTLTLKQPESA